MKYIKFKKNETQRKLYLKAISYSLDIYAGTRNKETLKTKNNFFLKTKSISADFIYNNFLKE